MNARLRNIVVASLAVVLSSLALALNNADLVTYLDYGAPWTSSQAQQEVLLVSTTPVVGVAAGNQAAQENLQLKRELEALGIWVD